MFRFKVFFLSVLAGPLLVAGCKAPRYLQGYKDIVDSSFIKQIAVNLSGGFDSITDYRMFRARISEKLVEANTVAEYNLMNELSKKKTVDLLIKRSYNELYYYELSSVNDQRYGVFLAATFATESDSVQCIGLGPLYIGFVGKGDNNTRKFVVEKEYALKKSKENNGIRLQEQKGVPKLYWVYGYVNDDNSDRLQIKFSEILQRGKNKVSGINKPLVYDIENIFNDPDALRFSLLNDNKR